MDTEEAGSIQRSRERMGEAVIKEVGPIYGAELISTLKLKGAMMQAMPCCQDLRRAQSQHMRVVAGYEVLLSKYHKLLTACRAVQAAVDKHCANTGSVLWIEPPYQNAAVHESVAERLSGVIEDCEEVT